MKLRAKALLEKWVVGLPGSFLGDTISRIYLVSRWGAIGPFTLTRRILNGLLMFFKMCRIGKVSVFTALTSVGKRLLIRNNSTGVYLWVHQPEFWTDKKACFNQWLLFDRWNS